MSGNSPQLNPLESRKQLLLAESELNRAQLVVDMAALSADVNALTERAKSLGSLASSAAMLVAGLAAFRRGKPEDAAAKPSLFKRILRGAGVVSSLWLAFRSRGGTSNDR